MIEQPLLSGVENADPGFVMPFRHRQIGDDILVTNDVGDWILLSPADFRRYVEGGIEPKEPLYARLRDRRMLAGDLDEQEMVKRMSRRYRFLNTGPHLHIMVVTLRCDHTCRYCQASRVPMGADGFDMTPETAERVVDTVFMSPSPWITIEFQGGEPLANFPIIQHVIEYAETRNKLAGKKLAFTLVTNLTLMDDEKLDYLMEHRVELCTSLDGPEDVHDYSRITKDGGAYRHTIDWIARINARYAEVGLDPEIYRVEAILTTTRPALSRPRDVIDTYVKAGCRAIFLRPLSPFGFATRTAEQIGYTMDAWLDFWREALAYVIELNRQGVDILERNAGIFLTKILTGDDPNYLDLRSPCGAGIGQIAYSHDGKVFTCDEGRMVHRSGDPLFLLGDVETHGYRDLVGHPTVRAMAVASLLDGQPDCTTCAYKPYCGTCPVWNYSEQRSIQGRMRDSSLCKRNKGIQDHLFGLLREAESDPELLGILERWTVARERPHFVHD